MKGKHKMKKINLVSGVLLLTSACFAADMSFSLTFDGKTVNPELPLTNKPVKALTLNDDNFVKGFNNKDAFVLTNQANPTYTANSIVNFGESTVSFWFKPVNWMQDKPARFLHIYSPSKDKKSLLIYYFLKKSGSNDIIAKISGSSSGVSNVTEVTIPGDSIAQDAWQKIDIAWNTKTLTIYRNGEKICENPMFEAFTELIKEARDWTGFGVLPVFISDGDSWDIKTAIDNVAVYKSALTGKEIKESYDKDMENVSK
jgi:hypothetical protein